MDWAQFAKNLETLAQGLNEDLSRTYLRRTGAQTEAALPFRGDGFEYLGGALQFALNDALEVLHQFSHNGCDSRDLLEFAARTVTELADAERAVVWADTQCQDRYNSFIKALRELPKVIPLDKLGRRDFYVYTHRDKNGQIFYVGKGSGKRAWSKERDALWHHYVETRSGGVYTVQIVKDGLLEREALEIEDELMLEHGEYLVNWSRPLPSLEVTIANGQITARTVIDKGRNTDSAALERHNQMHDANLKFVQETKAIEECNPEQAVINYRKALETMREYESIVFERGLVADLMAEVHEKIGAPVILDRLTLCLKKLNRLEEMIAESERYFSEFPGARNTRFGEGVLKRVERARKSTAQSRLFDRLRRRESPRFKNRGNL
jgi:hypothetical protein